MQNNMNELQHLTLNADFMNLAWHVTHLHHYRQSSNQTQKCLQIPTYFTKKHFQVIFG